MNKLISIDDLTIDDINDILELANKYKEIMIYQFLILIL